MRKAEAALLDLAFFLFVLPPPAPFNPPLLPFNPYFFPIR
jgi:hypothetical protein